MPTGGPGGVVKTRPARAVDPLAAGQQPGLDEGLKTVADTEHRLARVDKATERVTQAVFERERPGHPRAEVVAVGEAARQHQHLRLAEAFGGREQRLHGDDLGARASELTRPRGLAVAVGADSVQDEDARLHRATPAGLAP